MWMYPLSILILLTRKSSKPNINAEISLVRWQCSGVV